MSGADVMDRVERPGLEASGQVMLHDATATPWPIPGGRYDLFVALQVFEHLGTSQRAAFAEVRRVARHAIISLPIEWEMDDPRTRTTASRMSASCRGSRRSSQHE